MKNLIVLLIITLTLSCKAQTIIPMYGGIEFEHNENYYLKDTDNVLDNYEGTWTWENGNISFTLLLKKFEQIQMNSGLYRDYLLGEYQYIDNGNELVNTLALINFESVTLYKHMLWSQSIIYKNRKPQCDDCALTERRVRMQINHPDISDVSGIIVLRYINENGVEKLIGTLWDNGPGVIDENRTDPTDLNMPNGEYIFIKQ